ncbi:hypothetical protein GUITHDRAFT_164052 [Guillardia theta CCMP2712]|uniref:NADP-dependent oxidoreductase domain-containing protein n=1 Tax=Guillardia theta (strain CCMP2712) TaxID=905079 RepID=L1J380_GUITC|nr:hypothetical protein GUITHDRAFT_164052 [Guillardia theta CCMP2712]EKX42594.1 hypothetical protein GUITHDRAFT_164052 [Guillardia theta CCMP2712]|eukprot:XP_005829574.1 hypothetical protein GUITHDRAFT_164052 [Guillardia theta CCMP2712]
MAGMAKSLSHPTPPTLTRKQVFYLGLLWLFQAIPAISKEDSGLALQVGLGTCCPCERVSPFDQTKRQVLDALRVGYRFVDTAAHYNNERSIGEAIDEAVRAVGLRSPIDCDPIVACSRQVASKLLQKSDVKVCSKIWFDDMGYDQTKKAFGLSCSNLNVDDSLELMLIHFPGTIDTLQSPAKNKKLRSETWRALEDLKMAGKVKHIGVSNYVRRHMKELLASCRIKPDVVQMEIHPYFQQRELVSFCQQQGIQVHASSPLAHGDRQLLQDPTLHKLSSKYKKSVPQVIIRWLLQENILPIVKSESSARLQENFQSTDFRLTEEELQEIRSLDRDKRVGFDPNLIV